MRRRAVDRPVRMSQRLDHMNPTATFSPNGRAITTASSRWTRRRVQTLGWAIAAIPLLALASRVAPSHWVSFSDWASIELRTRDVGTRFTPLVGPYC
jgi:hypothetical protein